MNKMYIVLILLVLISACSDKDEPEYRHPRQPPRRGRMAEPPKPVFGDINRMKKDLDLTESQIKRIEVLNETFGRKHKDSFERMKPYKEQLKTLLRVETINYDNVRSVLMQIAEIDVDRQIIMIKHRLAIEAVLTEE